MRKILIILSAMLLLRGLCFAADDCGFRGMKWGSPLPSKRFIFFRTQPSYGGINEYLKQNEQLKFGAGEALGITYGFWHGKFFMVTIVIKGYANFSGIREAATAKWGKPYQSDENVEKYSWTKMPETQVLMEYNSVTEFGYLYILSRRIGEEAKKWAKDQAAKGKDAF